MADLAHDEIVEAMQRAMSGRRDVRLNNAAAALSALRDLAEKRGYRLMVPREADEPMQIAAIDRPAADAIERGIYLSVWSAMLAAAPDPTQGGT